MAPLLPLLAWLLARSLPPIARLRAAGAAVAAHGPVTAYALIAVPAFALLGAASLPGAGERADRPARPRASGGGPARHPGR